MRALVKGENVELGRLGELHSLGLGLRWLSNGVEFDPIGLVLSADSKVLSDNHFLYWNNAVSPSRTVMLRSRGEQYDGLGDRSQLLIDFDGLEPGAARVLIALATVVDGATINAARDVELRVFNPATGEDTVGFVVPPGQYQETCLVVGEVYAHRAAWKFRAVGQGWASGLRGLGTDYGVNID